MCKSEFCNLAENSQSFLLNLVFKVRFHPSLLNCWNLHAIISSLLKIVRVPGISDFIVISCFEIELLKLRTFTNELLRAFCGKSISYWKFVTSISSLRRFRKFVIYYCSYWWCLRWAWHRSSSIWSMWVNSVRQLHCTMLLGMPAHFWRWTWPWTLRSACIFSFVWVILRKLSNQKAY